MGYWRALVPHLGRFGITRVADITGLDRLGLPVAQAVRPCALSNAVTQGKGLTKQAAAISAVLECVEMASGERLGAIAPWPGPVLDDVRRMWAVLAPGHADWPGPDTGWMVGEDITGEEPAPVPMAVCSTDFSRGGPFEGAPVLRSSIGLGAGKTRAQAIRHGLLECIENDARVRFQGAATDRSRQITEVRNARDVLCAVHATVRGASLRVQAWDMTVRSGPACVMVRIMEDPDGNAALPLPAEGFAARPNQADAVLAALLEAVQARLAVISGAREDMTRALYRQRVAKDVLRGLWEVPELAVFAGNVKKDGYEPGIREIAARLRDQGLGPAMVVPLLEETEIPLHVVRVVVPGLLADPLRLTSGART